MPLRLDIKKKLSTRTDRVKSVDISIAEPWVLIGLYTGHLQIWNYDTQQLVKSFEVADQTPIRFAKFITRKQWIICGSDDMMVRVFNVNTMEKVREFEAHMDYIRSLEVHPVHPYVLTSSDDMQIKLWDWEKQWSNIQSFDGHSHYVMMVKFNPKDTNTFASASLDRSVKVWSLGNSLPNYSLEGHQAGVNCVDYFQGGDKPYIASGSDDHTVKIWDYQTKACVHTLQNHTNNVSAVVFHPSLPIIISGSEDGTLRVWHSTTYRLENTLNYGMERCWALGVSTFSNRIAAGYDEGVVVLQMGREMPVVSMDKSGKILLATSKDIQAGALRNLSDEKIHDGEIIELPMKTAGPTEVHLQMLEHNLNGRFVVACGDGEYVIYTAQALRNKSFGQAIDFGWSTKAPNDYCVRDHQGKIHIFQDFKEVSVFSCSGFTPEALFGGYLVGVASTDSITFYTWQGKEACKIDVCPRAVFWSEEGDHVCLACDESFFILSCDQDALQNAVNVGESAEKCFEYLDEIAETAKTGQWIGDCFIYTNSAHRLNYYVGGEIITLAHLDREQILLGFLPKENRVFLMDKSRAISSYLVLEPILKYQTAVVRGNFQEANSLLPAVPRQHHGKIARFLEAKGFKEAALAVAVDAEHKFELALQLEKFDVALNLMREEIAPKSAADVSADIASKWKQLGDLALSRGNVNLAEECAVNASDLSSLLLIYSSTGNQRGLRDLFEKSSKVGMFNISFIAALLLQDYSSCVQVLKDANRTPEASFMALNFCPIRVSELVQKWKKEMIESGHGLGLRIAKALADPAERPDLFPNFEQAIEKTKRTTVSSKSVTASPPPEKRPFQGPADVEPPIKNSPRPVQPSSPVSNSPSPLVQPKIESPKVVSIPEPPKVKEAPVETQEKTKFIDVTDQADAQFAEKIADELIEEAIEMDVQGKEEFEDRLEEDLGEVLDQEADVEDEPNLEEDWS